MEVRSVDEVVDLLAATFGVDASESAHFADALGVGHFRALSQLAFVAARIAAMTEGSGGRLSVVIGRKVGALPEVTWTPGTSKILQD